jgi:hypothetical protein
MEGVDLEHMLKMVQVRLTLAATPHFMEVEEAARLMDIRRCPGAGAGESL